jgi:lipid-binding SYLF domain-containing protein
MVPTHINSVEKAIMKIPVIIAAAGMAASSMLIAAQTLAETKPEIDVSVRETLKQFDGLNSRNAQLLSRAAGTLIFPSVTKGGVGVAGEYGEGALRVDGRTVGYYSVSSASIGLTVGVAKRSEVIVFTTKDALDKFTSSKGWSVGADTAVAVISKGAGGDYDTETLRKPVVGFVFAEKGLIADLSLEGSKITKIDR